MDGLRKVPDNVPNRSCIAPHLGKPLTEVPDPFGTHASFGAHNNARLRAFLDAFGFDYEFLSSTECYRSGRFDATLLHGARALRRRHGDHAAVAARGARSRPIRRSCRSIRGPATSCRCRSTRCDRDAGTIVWRDPATGERFETPVTGGHAKLQWKPDWAMRWVALGVDYEMAGKDLIDSREALGRDRARPRRRSRRKGFNYELFLDEKGQKISKSKGNGLTIDEWLAYGTPESLSLFMYNKPREAKRLHFDVIPRQVDDYLTFLEKYPGQDAKAQLGNPVWHIHAGEPPAPEVVARAGGNGRARRSRSRCCSTSWRSRIPRSRRCCGASSAATRRASRRRRIRASTGSSATRCATSTISCGRRRATGCRTRPSARRSSDLAEALAPLEGSTDAEALQAVVYEVGRPHFPDTSGKSKSPDGRPGVPQTWFATIYRVLLGQERGPRFGSFVALYGVAETRALIAKALAGELLREHEAFLAERARAGGGIGRTHRAHGASQDVNRLAAVPRAVAFWSAALLAIRRSPLSAAFRTGDGVFEHGVSRDIGEPFGDLRPVVAKRPRRSPCRRPPGDS